MQYFRRVVKENCVQRGLGKVILTLELQKRTCMWNWKCSYNSSIVLTYSANGPYSKVVPKYFLYLKTTIKAIKYALCKYCDILYTLNTITTKYCNKELINDWQVHQWACFCYICYTTRFIVNGCIQCLYIILTKFIVVASAFSFFNEENVIFAMLCIFI